MPQPWFFPPRDPEMEAHTRESRAERRRQDGSQSEALDQAAPEPTRRFSRRCASQRPHVFPLRLSEFESGFCHLQHKPPSPQSEPSMNNTGRQVLQQVGDADISGPAPTRSRKSSWERWHLAWMGMVTEGCPRSVKSKGCSRALAVLTHVCSPKMLLTASPSNLNTGLGWMINHMIALSLGKLKEPRFLTP